MVLSQNALDSSWNIAKVNPPLNLTKIVLPTYHVLARFNMTQYVIPKPGWKYPPAKSTPWVDPGLFGFLSEYSNYTRDRITMSRKKWCN